LTAHPKIGMKIAKKTPRKGTRQRGNQKRGGVGTFGVPPDCKYESGMDKKKGK